MTAVAGISIQMPGFLAGPGDDAYTELLLHADGANGSTSFYDASKNGFTMVNSGTAVHDTSQSKFGNSSLLLDGTNYIYPSGASSILALGTGEWTIECWMRATDWASTKVIHGPRPTGVAGGSWPLIYAVNGKLVYHAGGSIRINSTSMPLMSTNTWIHMVCTRIAGGTRFFLDGVQTGPTYTDSINYVMPADRPLIGGYGYNPGASGFIGNIDEFRISKGIARWTADFTPPTRRYG